MRVLVFKLGVYLTGLGGTVRMRSVAVMWLRSERRYLRDELEDPRSTPGKVEGLK